MKTVSKFTKTSFIRSICVMITLLIISACSEKTHIDESTSSGNERIFKSGYLDSIQTVDGRLLFPTLSSLNGALDELGGLRDSLLRVFEESLDYNSLRSEYDYVDDSLPNDDVLIGTIFNSIKLLQVDDFVLKIDGNDILAIEKSLFNEDPEDCWDSEDVIRVENGDNLWQEIGLDNEDCSQTNRSDQSASGTYNLINALGNDNQYHDYGFKMKISYNSTLGITHKYKIKSEFGLIQNGIFQYLNQSFPSLLPQSTYSMKLVDYKANLDPRCRDCIVKQKTNETMWYWFEETLYSSIRGLQYHKGRVKCKLTIGSVSQESIFLTMESWVPSSVDCSAL